jgi:hypothetical protein
MLLLYFFVKNRQICFRVVKFEKKYDKFVVGSDQVWNTKFEKKYVIFLIIGFTRACGGINE